MDTILLVDFNNLMWKTVSIDYKEKEDKAETSYTDVYFFFRNIISLIERFYPRKIFLCGEGGKSFRHTLLSSYKGNRIIKTAEEETPRNKEDFYRQVNITWDLCQCLPLHRVYAKTYEADDVIATLAFSLKEEDTIIISNDNDFIQLLQKKELPNITLFDPFKREYIEAPPYFHLTYKICAGDKADNIPGLMPPKKAVGIASDPLKLATFISSEENRANYNLNKELMELKPIPDDQLVFMTSEKDYIYITEKFVDMKFNSFLREFGSFKKTFDTLS